MNREGEILYTLILFHSTSHAIRGEKLLQQGGIGCRMIPVPRHISSDCGSCIRVLRDDAEAVKAVLKGAGVPLQGVQDI